LRPPDHCGTHLSPDGSKLVYFAQKINRRTLSDSEYTYAWTAVSRPPYFTALALWPKGDCWNGGGLFETNSRLWLNHHGGSRPHPEHRPRGLEVRGGKLFVAEPGAGGDWPERELAVVKRRRLIDPAPRR